MTAFPEFLLGSGLLALLAVSDTGGGGGGGSSSLSRISMTSRDGDVADTDALRSARELADMGEMRRVHAHREYEHVPGGTGGSSVRSITSLGENADLRR